MTQNSDKIEIRDLRNGEWYWIPKAVIHSFGPRIGTRGLAVYNLLAASADRGQTCYPSQKWMAECLGCSRATVNKTIKELVAAGLIRIEKRDRYRLVYTLLSVRCQPGETQMSTGGNSDVSGVDTNKKVLTRINNNNGVLKNKKDNFKTSKEFEPVTREDLLALDLAQGLEDQKSLPIYLTYARKYPEGMLRRVLSEVRQVPDSKIKKSRLALFKYLVQIYASKAT